MEIILTIMADDRPGIAQRVAKEIEQYQGNWLESRMATMAGKFAGIVRVDIPQEQMNKAEQALLALREEGVSIHIEQGETKTVLAASEHLIKVVANDRYGIVHEVTDALAALAVNVTDLHTEIEPASMSGGSLFRAEIEITLTDTQKMDDVVRALEALSPDLMIDF
ncbi:MAG: ACT domain-containing protein [Reinekea sp.]|jgi:glycine cleavage system regulatory protein